MAGKQEEIKRTVEEKASPLLASLRKVVLASVGAVAIAQDEAEDLVNKLVERGEIARQEGRKLVEDLTATRREKVEGTFATFEAKLDAALRKMNVSAKDDLKRVDKKLDEISGKLDKLLKG